MPWTSARTGLGVDLDHSVEGRHVETRAGGSGRGTGTDWTSSWPAAPAAPAEYRYTPPSGVAPGRGRRPRRHRDPQAGSVGRPRSCLEATSPPACPRLTRAVRPGRSLWQYPFVPGHFCHSSTSATRPNIDSMIPVGLRRDLAEQHIDALRRLGAGGRRSHRRARSAPPSPLLRPARSARPRTARWRLSALLLRRRLLARSARDGAPCA